ncbi:hypothetical protein PDESU_01018 [Pontiella desulfatans]|uniref:Lipoprotein n=1 Tax=Pontiella desulfatans TaxID=2750659 RepID=A0A6C2TXU4_PONDE|nr:hypothetical protein [Pontiella desulfatans]VGO12465.1 hypothetical protein PDESU_01018 [Pontiella desulfatans]
MKKQTLVKISAMAALALLAGCKAIPPDNAELTEMKFDGIGGSRYTEILLVYGNGLTKNVTAGVYNTVGMNGADPKGPGDSSPLEILDAIDLKQVKKDNKALSVVKNGPRRWTIDYLGVKAGKVRDFQGLKAHWVMWFPIPPAMLKGVHVPYESMNALRDTSMGIRKGTRVYLLDDPDGNTWCMKAMSNVKFPDQKFEDLKDLGSRLELPEGWKFRSIELGKELVFTTDNGKTMILQDELDNTYDRVGGPYSNYKP